MDTETREIYKTPLFWAACVTALVVIAFLILLVADRPVKTQPEPTATTVQTQPPTTEEPTLPPPPANPYTLFDFALEGDYITCTAGESVLGIDVSEWQAQVDWDAVKAAGMEFVMIRVGWRGSEQGILAADTCAQRHYQGAKAAGLKVGAYFFSQSISPQEAEEEAVFALQQMEGWQLDMPVVYDWEYIDETSRTARVDARTLTDATKAFCDTVAAAGYSPMVYFNEIQAEQRMYLEELTDYGFWLAQYKDRMHYPYKVDLWQYTCTGRVPGIDGDVDINLYFPYG